MKYISSVIFIIILLVCFIKPAAAEISCIICHQELDDNLKLPVDEALDDDVHYKNGITCAGCHGGVEDSTYADDMDEAMNSQKGYLGVPKHADIPKLCAKCHSNSTIMRTYNPTLPTGQYQQYQTSQHGQLLKKGDRKVAVCTSCHGVHHIQPANNPTSKVFASNIPATCGECHNNPVYMTEYKIPTDQFEQYKKSVHGIALFEKGDRSAPTCNDCHGNHGAYPPGISSISHVCGTCHITQAEMFAGSPHKQAFEDANLPQCESCHGNHEVQHTYLDMLGVGEASFCHNCHDEGSQGYIVARTMKAAEDSLVAQIHKADSLLKRAEKAGVEVSEGKFILKDAMDDLVKVRNAIHHFSLDKFQEIIKPGIEVADKALKEGELALNEVQSRRRWLAYISVVIFLTAISLYAKIKSMKANDV